MLEDFTRIAFLKRNEYEKVTLVLNGFVTGEGGKPFFRPLLWRGSESVEVEDIFIDFGEVGAPLRFWLFGKILRREDMGKIRLAQ